MARGIPREKEPLGRPEDKMTIEKLLETALKRYKAKQMLNYSSNKTTDHYINKSEKLEKENERLKKKLKDIFHELSSVLMHVDSHRNCVEFYLLDRCERVKNDIEVIWDYL